MALFRNAQGVNFPYDVGWLASIGNSSDGQNFYYYFCDWELVKTCVSDTVAVDVNFVPVVAPSVSDDSISIICNGLDTLTASGNDGIVWYDVMGEEVARGDTFFISQLKDTATFFAINETSGRFIKGGEFDNTFGRGGFTQTSNEWMIFDVHEPVQLRSVKVFARAAGNRTIQYRDNLGNILDSVTVFVPQGESRVNLEFQLQVGTDHELAVVGTVDLFRNNENVAYPYDIGSYVTLTRSNALLPLVFYHYFYDWEVGDPGCQSPAIPVYVDVTPLNTPMVSAQDTICYNEQDMLSSTASTGAWLDANGNILGYGSTYTTNPLTSSSSFSHIAESQELLQAVGPVDWPAVGPGGYHNASFNAFLEFTIEAPIRLNSFWVDAETGGVRDIILQDANGNTLQTIRKLIPAGQGRVYVGLELQPGDYAIGGSNMRLFRNDNGPAYPYNLPGVLSITGTSTGSNFYYYFYDWEVQDLPCQSDTVQIDVAVSAQIVPFFSYNQMDSTITLNNSSLPMGASYSWDFGDGNGSTMEEPTHTYADTGWFTITLTVSNGPCQQSYTDSVYVEAKTDGIEDLLTGSFELYPNPGEGRFNVRAQAIRMSEMQLRVYDLQGRLLYQSDVQRSLQFAEEVDLSNFDAGTYMVQLNVNRQQLTRRYVLMK